MGYSAAAGRFTCFGILFPRLAVGGPRNERLRMDAAGGGAAGLGVLRVAQGAQGEAGGQGAKLGEPENFDVCPGRGIRADPAVVDSRGAAFRKNDGNAFAVSGIAMYDFLGSNFNCGHGVVLQGGDAEPATGPGEGALVDQFGDACHVRGANAGGLGADVGPSL